MGRATIHELVLSSDIEDIKTLLTQKVPLDNLDSSGHTPLHWAVFRGDIDVVKILLEAGANPNSFSADGVTPKWRAQDFGLEDIADLLTAHGGKVQTKDDFDRASFSAFAQLIGQPLPNEDSEPLAQNAKLSVKSLVAVARSFLQRFFGSR